MIVFIASAWSSATDYVSDLLRRQTVDMKIPTRGEAPPQAMTALPDTAEFTGR
jgi:hypothetical protein